MLHLITLRCTKLEDDVQFKVIHRHFGSLRNTVNYRPLYSKESVRRVFETLRKLIFVTSDRLIQYSACDYDVETTTHIFYFNDHFSNGESHLDWIGIHTARNPLEKRLRKSRSHSETVFCSCFPIFDLRLRIRSCNSSCNSFVVVLFEMC